MHTKKQYVEHLISPPKNCTCPYLADHLEDVSHDVVSDFLPDHRFLPRALWKLVKDRIEDSKDACLIVDDSVQDKRAILGSLPWCARSIAATSTGG